MEVDVDLGVDVEVSGCGLVTKSKLIVRHNLQCQCTNIILVGFSITTKRMPHTYPIRVCMFHCILLHISSLQEGL